MLPSRRLAVTLLAAILAGGAAADTQPGAARQRELVRLVRQDCGSCHGLTLKGGLGPALLPGALRDKPLEALRYTILLGRPGTAMPAWKTILSEAEADWIARRLVEGFPEER
ncbi:MAG: cytochrome c [Pseudomonadota bacterium]|jgi:cytochrome c55X